jgi:hypothetical protein
MNIASAFDISTVVESDYNDKISMNETYLSQQEKVALHHANDYGVISPKCCEGAVCSFAWGMRYDEKTETIISSLIRDNSSNHDIPIVQFAENNEYISNAKSIK